jgi:molecular chaperone DnaK
MARATIDFGIDLGTTNSEIALLEGGRIRVFKTVDQRQNTPSVVRILQDGTEWVGLKAYDKVEDQENRQAVFKRIMGTSHRLHLPASGRTLSPEELSALVLKSLKADVVRAGFDDCLAAVITVPAYFEIVQCEATQRAAKLAGLFEAPLLQEPIAAALAYAKDAPPRDGYWLVYDLGGGTFDVAIIKSTDGHLSIVECGGGQLAGRYRLRLADG